MKGAGCRVQGREGQPLDTHCVTCRCKGGGSLQWWLRWTCMCNANSWLPCPALPPGPQSTHTHSHPHNAPPPPLLHQAESFRVELQRANSEITALLREKSNVSARASSCRQCCVCCPNRFPPHTQHTHLPGSSLSLAPSHPDSPCLPLFHPPDPGGGAVQRSHSLAFPPPPR